MIQILLGIFLMKIGIGGAIYLIQ
ncbi:hypothetical protein CGSHi3655_06814 [Haemophilus influenzae 3655]|uniref:Uncharacterized protein n=2 Tax=Haemophilus influenzae TaxID=727 RepID=A4NXA0_HAEIF|nr:hypothetical protein CGSHi3655_06814 [Haemophilus influenzae 3655]EDK14260.1 hypothetical protein CGSHiR3021_07432 [Haemophilus influenzae 22.4-21]